MTLQLIDLSLVTDRLLKMLERDIRASRLWGPLETTPPPPHRPEPGFALIFTGLRPDDPKILEGCQVSLYLFHIAPDKFHRNTYPLGGAARPIPEQPLALTLYYLLSAHTTDGTYQEAQQVMSLALKSMHENAIVHSPTDPEHFTLTIEPESVDEIGRLWQSLACPLRMSAVYRVSVIFLEPEARVHPPTKRVVTPDVHAEVIEPKPHPVAQEATVTAIGYATIKGTHLDADSVELQIGGLVFQRFQVAGPLQPGQFRVVDAKTIEVQLPADTPIAPKQRYRWQVRLDPAQPLTEVWFAAT